MNAAIEALQSGVVLAAFALFGFTVVVGTLIKYRRRVDLSDSGLVLASMLSGIAIPRGLYIASYLIVPDPPGVHTRLSGYATEIFVAGFLLSFAAVCTLLSTREDAKKPRVVLAG
jgi:hypothetical protein